MPSFEIDYAGRPFRHKVLDALTDTMQYVGVSRFRKLIRMLLHGDINTYQQLAFVCEIYLGVRGAPVAALHTRYMMHRCDGRGHDIDVFIPTHDEVIEML